MDSYFEAGPGGPKSELAKVGEKAYAALKSIYCDLHGLSSTLIVNGNPETVTIEFKVSTHDIDPNTLAALDNFDEDVANLLSDYGIDDGDYSVTYETTDQTERRIIIKARD